MHGDIVVVSEVGVGSTFTVSLPRAPDVGDERTSSGASARHSILCIDDDAEGRRILTAVLAHVPGARTYCVATAVDGLIYLDRPRPDVIVLDRHVPDLSTDEVTRQIARVAPGCPVVLISSDATVLDPSETAPPVVAALAKPLDLDLFIQTVRAVLAPRH
jgi:DNA-binding NtrC family response regulator